MGRLLYIGSMDAKQPAESMMALEHSAAAVVGLMRIVASEYAPFGITANVLLPGIS